MIELYFQNTTDRLVRNYIAGVGPKVIANVNREMTRQMILLSRRVAEGHLTGRPGLRNITGTLRRSVLASPRVSQTSSEIVGSVSTDPTVPYAKIHEFGGTVHVPELEPVRKKALANVAAGWGPFRRARAHEVTIPERSFMRSSLREMATEILDGLNLAIREGIQ